MLRSHSVLRSLQTLSLVGVPTYGYHSNNSYEWVEQQALEISFPAVVNILDGDLAFVNKIQQGVSASSSSYEMKKKKCIGSLAIYCLQSHWSSLQQVAPYLHKVELFSVLLCHWTRPHLVAKGCCCSRHCKSPALIDNEL